MSHFHNYSLFTITMRMTEEGEKVWQKIVSVIFQYLKLLREQGPQEWIYNECANLAQAQFKFLEKRAASNYTSSLATSMQRYPPEKVLSASYLYFRYDADTITKFLDQIVPENMNIYYSSKIHDSEATEEEEWYGVKYVSENLDPSLLEQWSRGDDASDGPSDVALPTPNPFVPEKFDIKETEHQTEYPVLLRDTNKTKLWHKQDYIFQQPKVNIFYNIVIPESYSSPRIVVMNRLFTLLVADALNEVSYEAEIAGVSYDIQPSVTGLVVYLSGYNDKIAELNRVVFEHIVKLVIDPQRFELIKTDLSDQYKNLRKNQPYEHALTTSYEAMYLNKWTYDEYIQVIDTVNIQMLQNFVAQHLSCLKAETLIHGNMTKSEALELIDITENLLFGDHPDRVFKTIPPLKSQKSEERIVKLENGKDYLVQRKEPNTDSENSAIEIIYQIGLRDQVQDASLDLLAQILSNPYYSQLRTVEQLGYLVFSRARRDNNINSLSFILQSGDKTPLHMLARSDLFISQFHSVLEQLEEREFQEHVNGLRTMIEEKDKQLKEETIRYWKEIIHQQYLFNRAEQKVQALNTLTKNDILKFYETYVLPSGEHCRRMIIMYFAPKLWPPVSEEPLTREPIVLPELITEWKQNMYFYPGFTKH
jgi:insulysin